jgi:hypothetical protein
MEANKSLEGAALRRSELEVAMQQVERTAAAPAANTSWVDDLTHAVRQLEIALDHHIVEVEAPSGLLDQIVDTAPRLQRSAGETRRHHTLLTSEVIGLLGRLGTAREGGRQDVDGIRTAVIDLLNELARHRQQGADLIYEAYDVDIGGY